jgi:hypothetical protein
MNYWTNQMIPPYKRKFILYSEIADCISGIVRMIEFRCFAGPNAKTQDDQTGDHIAAPAQADPSVEGAHNENWVLGMTEGDFMNGVPHGFARRIDAFNGHGRMGFFQNGLAHGKYCEADVLSKSIWSKPGLYHGKENCVKELTFKDFLENVAPPSEEGDEDLM